MKDLGVIMENTGSFESQITNAVKRSISMSSWVFRAFKTRAAEPMITLFKSMVLPHLEYCCQLWSPYLLKDIRRLEAVQRSFTARILGLGHLSYWERLANLKLYSLENAGSATQYCMSTR